MYTEATEIEEAKAEVKKRAEGITPPARLRHALRISLILFPTPSQTHTLSISLSLALFFLSFRSLSTRTHTQRKPKRRQQPLGYKKSRRTRTQQDVL